MHMCVCVNVCVCVSVSLCVRLLSLRQSLIRTCISFPSNPMCSSCVCVCVCLCVRRELSVWTSNMRRAKDTAKEVKAAHHVEWRSLREIEVRGVVCYDVVWCSALHDCFD